MEERSVQYLVVDSSATLWSDEAPYFKANLASKEDLASAVCKQSEVPKSSTLLLRDAHNMWMSWQAVDELPQDGVLCVKVVKPVETNDKSVSFWDLLMGPLLKEADILLENLTERFSLSKHKYPPVNTETHELMHNDSHEHRPEVSYLPYRTQARHRSSSQTSR